MNRLKIPFKISSATAIFTVVLLMYSCTTKKNTTTTRAYHNLTSRYNGYFLANESLKECIKNIEKGTVDDYTTLLPIFIYADDKSVKTYYPDLDRAIEKASTCIQRHAIVDRKNIEVPGAVKWIDDNYFVIGRAYFYKQEFFKAQEMFEYISKQYKKEPIHYKAELWLIRTYCEMGTLSKAEAMIDQLKSDKKFPKDLKPELLLVSADFHMKRQGYESVLNYLQQAIAQTNKHRERARYNFILAQLYQQKNDDKKALNHYINVIKQKPYYDMEFNARMKVVQLYDGSSKKGKGLKKDLAKMLKDDKNIEYRDQIYYALAGIELKEGNTPLAIDYLKKSIAANLKNQPQKAMSYLRLADLYFDEAKYPPAQNYYDSTLLVMDKDHPEYQKIYNKRDNLSELVENLETAQREDSLLKIAAMDSAGIYTVIDRIIKQLEEDEAKKVEAAENLLQQQLNNANAPEMPANNVPGQPGQGSSLWYFYNPSARSMGYNDFIKKFGNRSLEDDWRRSNKQSAMAIITETSKSAAETNTAKRTNKMERAYYLQNLPVTAEDKKKSNQKIEEAYYNLGFIYREKLSNNTSASSSFEEVYKRYPNSKHKQTCYYQLYRIYFSVEDYKKADYYKNLLLTEFPDSEFAKIIQNPNYGKESMATRNEVEEHYSQTFDMFIKGQYMEVLKKCKYADSAYTNNFLMPKYDYLNAVCLGQTQGPAAYTSSLKQLVLKYPKDEVGLKAQEMLDILEKKDQPVIDTGATNQPKYSFADNDELYWVIVVPNQKIDMDSLKTTVADLNNNSFSTYSLNVSGLMLDNDRQMVIVKSFSEKTLAKNYFDFMNDDPSMQQLTGNNMLGSFIISATNYITFYKNKNIDEYLSFFNEKYLD